MPDPLTQQLAAKIAQKGPRNGPPSTMTRPPEPPEKKVDVAAEAKMLFESWKPTTDEGKRYKEELGTLVGGGVGPEELGAGPALGPGPGAGPLPV